ncbi:MAG: bifunctional 3-phosphoshikimate 1-carboxyvinyltransferase/cytidylate kinase [Burkholderiales bacterium]
MFSTHFLDIPALDSASGTVTLPGSKSISNRVLLLAALSEGTTELQDLLDSDDTRVMLNALRELGCRLQHHGTGLQVSGIGGQAPSQQLDLFMGNAGTAMRPLTAALALMGARAQLHGVPRMHERPIADLVDALRQLGCRIDYAGNEGYPPLSLQGHDGLRLDKPIQVRGDVSSQFLTALLLALPLVATQDIVVEVVGELISKPYIEITLNLLHRFGVHVSREGWQRFTVPAGSRYSSPGVLPVEADASSASYFIALGAIASVDGVRIQGVGADSIQGDIRFIDAARAMGADVSSGPNWVQTRRGAWPLKAIDLDCNQIPDAAMTLAAMALYADGPSTLRNIASGRVKETDRIAAMAVEARKLGATVEEGPDWIRIEPIQQWHSASIHTYDDHRIAMCFSLAAFNPAKLSVRIEDPKCVAKTFPDYFEALFSLSISTRVPVITIDGPTASGKGTLAALVAAQLGYHYLDSGALYRLTALASLQAGLSLEPANEAAIAELARHLPVAFEGERVLLSKTNVSEQIRTEEAGMNASKVSAMPLVRQALVELQASFQRLPGLVTDGRDMGTVIFPSADLKVFLTASAEKRAERRHKQLISKGISTTIDILRADLEARDARDTQSSVAPLKPAEDALQLDNSLLSIDKSVAQVMSWWQRKQVFGPGRT